jgi:hypothetical protein
MDYDPRRLTPRRRQHWGVEPDPELDPTFDPDAIGQYEVTDRRRLLWRDSATILLGVVLALLTGQALLPRSTGLVSGEPTGIPTGVAIGLSPPPFALPPGSTFGQILDPSLGIDATPTPIPVVTLGPTPTAAPTPTPTPRITPRPTRTPKPPPTAPPTPPPPPPTPPPTAPPPSPNAVVSCGQPAGPTVTCTSSSTDFLNSSEVWDMGRPGALVNGGDGIGSITWTYTDLGPYTVTVTLTVTGLDGSTTDSDSTSVDIL